MYTAMAELAVELEDAALKRTCEVLWRDLTQKRMYVTAGLGPDAANEGFTQDYDLPNDTAYAETCASVALIFWAQRMLHLDLDGRYADVLELALFNNALSGLSRDGEHYFYENPLDSDGRHSRWEWHICPCCTMNAARLIASVGGYFCSESADAVALHLYGGIEVTAELAGCKVKIKEESSYPWSGAVKVSIDPEHENEFSLKLRIPGWSKRASAAVNAVPVDMAGVRNGYLDIRRVWRKGDTVTLDLPMPAERLYAHPLVRMDVGRVALRRGPRLLPGGSRQRRPTDAAASSPTRRPAETNHPQRLVRRRGDDLRGRQGAGNRRLAERFVSKHRASRSRHQPDRHPLLPLEQSRQGSMTVWIAED